VLFLLLNFGIVLTVLYILFFIVLSARSDIGRIY